MCGWDPEDTEGRQLPWFSPSLHHAVRVSVTADGHRKPVSCWIAEERSGEFGRTLVQGGAEDVGVEERFVVGG